jgi:hypothetical protein
MIILEPAFKFHERGFSEHRASLLCEMYYIGKNVELGKIIRIDLMDKEDIITP